MLRILVLSFAVIALASCSGASLGSNEPEGATPGFVTDGDKKLPETTERPTSEKPSAKAYTPIRFNLASRDAQPTADERKQCLEAGGNVLRAGLLGAYHCVQKYPDAGKICRDSSECTGTCRATNHTDIGKQNVTGTCQEVDTPFGCYGMVENGAVGPMLCVD